MSYCCNFLEDLRVCVVSGLAVLPIKRISARSRTAGRTKVAYSEMTRRNCFWKVIGHRPSCSNFLKGRYRFMCRLANASIPIGRQWWSMFVLWASMIEMAVMKPLVCLSSRHGRLVYVIGPCQSQLNACVFRQAQTRKWFLSCIVADITTRRLDRWHGRRRNRCCTKLSRSRAELVYVKHR